MIVMGGLWLHPISFALIGLIIIAGLQYELSGIIKGGKPGDHREHSGLIISFLIYIVSSLVAFGFIDHKWLLLSIIIIPFIFIRELYKQRPGHIEYLAKLLFSIIYTTLPYILMLFVSRGNSGLDTLLSFNQSQFNAGIVIAFFILLWVNDTGAYLAGSTMGRHRLFERISPKKSWEGFAGGLLATLIVAWAISGWFDFFTLVDWLIIALLITVGSTFGDLFESLIKREKGIKDSGSILPGHGGFLDRFDGVAIAFPIVYLYITFFA